MDNTSLPSIIVPSQRTSTGTTHNNDLYAIVKQRKELFFILSSRLKKEIRMTENRITMIQKEEQNSQRNLKEIKRRINKMKEIQDMKTKLGKEVNYILKPIETNG